MISLMLFSILFMSIELCAMQKLDEKQTINSTEAFWNGSIGRRIKAKAQAENKILSEMRQISSVISDQKQKNNLIHASKKKEGYKMESVFLLALWINAQFFAVEYDRMMVEPGHQQAIQQDVCGVWTKKEDELVPNQSKQLSQYSDSGESKQIPIRAKL